MNHFVHCCSFSTSNEITSKGCQSASKTCDFDAKNAKFFWGGILPTLLVVAHWKKKNTRYKCISKSQTRHTWNALTRTVTQCELQFYKGVVELMLSCDRHVALQLTVFEIFVFFESNFFYRFLRSLEVPLPKGEKTRPGKTCTIVQIFTITGARYMSIPVKIYILFVIRDSPRGLASHSIHFRKLPCAVVLMLSCN